MSDWRDLPAGPELDALVAERVLGWRWCLVQPRFREPGEIGRGIILPFVQIEDLYGGGYGATPVDERPAQLWNDWARELRGLQLSTTWAGAGLVAEAMDARGHTLVLYRLHARGTWKAEFSSACCQEASTAPLAIARAALAAKSEATT